MSLPNELLPVGLLGAGAAGGYQIERSLRFNSADSAYLSKTFASAGNRATWTLSFWVKRGKINTNQNIFATDDVYGFYFKFDTANTFTIIDYYGNTGQDVVIRTNAVYRDPSAWYHFVYVLDTPQATAADRAKLYVNGVQVTSFSTATYPAQNTTSGSVNAATSHVFGRIDSSTGWYFDGYLADIHFIDGQALDPTSFGEFDSDTGVWNPVQYNGTYGQNGFHLPFSDNSTASALGTDTSGNGNDWTVNNISVTAGADNDSLVDTPTNYGTDTGAGGEVRGNYSTLNPINPLTCTLANGNLECTTPVSGSTFGSSTFNIPKSGKWYWEFTTTTNGDYSFSGVRNIIDITQYVVYWAATGEKYVNGVASAYGASCTTGDIIGVAVDSDAGTLTFYKNNVSQGAISVSFASGNYAAVFQDGTSSLGVNFTVNFGQRPFVYQAPTDHKCLCSTNLPTPTIEKGSEYFDTVLYTGNDTTQTISGIDFSPDLVWLKSRSAARSHGLFDTVRGINARLMTDSTGTEVTTNNQVTAFTADGFTLGGAVNYNDLNASMVAWAWDAGSSTVTNNDGTISSQVRANPSAGFSIVAFNSGTSGQATIGHGLNATPSLIITKSRTVSPSNWTTYHVSGSSLSSYLNLNTTAGFQTASNIWGTSFPTSSVFGFLSGTNQSANSDCIAYCFAPVEGYSAFGSYTGNGSADGPVVFCNFRPAFIMIKITSTSGDWSMFDNSRIGYNPRNWVLYPNLPSAEVITFLLDITSNGFKIRSSNALVNTSAATYVYAAFAENPFSLSRAR